MEHTRAPMESETHRLNGFEVLGGEPDPAPPPPPPSVEPPSLSPSWRLLPHPATRNTNKVIELCKRIDDLLQRANG
jgi:hypothetical protein